MGKKYSTGEASRIKLILVIPPLILTSFSYIRYYLSARPDYHVSKFNALPLPIVVILFIAIIVVFGYVYYKIVMNDKGWKLSPRDVSILSVAIIIIITPMLPILSNDIFSVLAYGDLALKGVNPYLYNQLYLSDFYSLIIHPIYKTAPCVYGPVSLLVSAISVYIGGTENLLRCIIVYKAFNGIFALVMVYFISKLEVKEDSTFNLHALVLLSPILWLQGLGEGHNDLIAAAFIAGSLYYCLKNKYDFAAVMVSLAVNTKLSSIIIIPLFIIFLFDKYKGNLMKFFMQTTICFTIFTVISVIAWYPFFIGIEVFTIQLSYLSNLPPANSIASSLVYLADKIIRLYNFLSIVDLNDSERRIFIDYIIASTKIIFGGVFLVSTIALVKRNLYKASPAERVAFFAVLGVAFLTIFSVRFLAWYLLIIFPFFLYLNSREWIIWIIFAGIILNFLDFQNLLKFSGPYKPIYMSFKSLISILFIWQFHKRYFSAIENERLDVNIEFIEEKSDSIELNLDNVVELN